MKRLILALSMVILTATVSFAQFVANFKDASGTASASSSLALSANNSRQYLLIQNISSNTLGFTVDGTTAAIGTAGTVTLAAGQGVIFQQSVPAGAINVIGSSAGTTYTIKYL